MDTLNQSRYSLKSVCALVFALILSACQSPSPRSVFTDTIEDTPIELHTVLLASKCELAKAFVAIKNQGIDVKIYDGTMEFSGTIKTTKDKGFSISAVIPLGAEHVLEPDFGYGNTAVTTQNIVLKNKLSSTVKDTSVCQSPTLANFDTGNFISEAIISTADGIASIPTGPDGKAYQPSLNETELNITTSFNVVKLKNGGVALKYVWPTSREHLDGLTPGGTLDNSIDTTYTLTIKLPLVATNPPVDPRKIMRCKNDISSGETICIESPYIVSANKNDAMEYDDFPSRGVLWFLSEEFIQWLGENDLLGQGNMMQQQSLPFKLPKQPPKNLKGKEVDDIYTRDR